MNSPYSYLGGKNILSRKIIKLIPNHHCYCEPFMGGAWVFFRKPQISKVEILNDINGELVNLSRIIQNHIDEFIRYLRWILVARDEFERFKHSEPTLLTDIQRAVRYYYLMKTCFGARLDKPNFSIGASMPSRFNLRRVEEDLSQAHLRLSRVYIENRDFRKVIQSYDKEDTFFYIDPPYWGVEDYYGKGIFKRADFNELRDLLSNLKGKFILSINDVDEIRALFSEFNIQIVNTLYTAKTGVPKKAIELLISN